MIAYRTVSIDGLDIFYREAGSRDNPTLSVDMALYDRISAEVGDEILGSPGTLPCA